MVRKSLAVLLLAAALIIPAFGEGDLSMELGISNLLLQTREVNTDAEKYWGWMTTGSGAFSFKSSGSKNVKADLAFSFAFPEADLSSLTGSASTGISIPMLSIDRAFIKARFPSFRITAGKTRLGWGDGFVFNSGDIIFGSTDTSVDLTASEVRTDTQWLAALNIPLGRFSFLEGVILAPEADSDAGFIIGRADKTSAGGRFYTKLSNVKVEGGYFFDQSGEEFSADSWDNARHRPYLALQGNLLADWYMSLSTALPVSGELEEQAKDSFNISGGLFHMVSLNSISSLTFRLEGLYRPFHSWEEEVHTAGGETPDYALLLYPEIGWTPTDTVNLSARAIWSPVDMSAMLTAGAGWNVFEGL